MSTYFIARSHTRKHCDQQRLKENGERNECGGVLFGFADGNEIRGHGENVE